MKKIPIIFALLFSVMIFAGAASGQANDIDSPAQDDKVYTYKEVDKQPKVTKKKRANAYLCSPGRGHIKLQVLFHKSGKVTQVKELEFSPCRGFNKSAVELTWKIEFKPALKDGQPVSMWKTVIYVYEVEE